MNMVAKTMIMVVRLCQSFYIQLSELYSMDLMQY